ncbi:hypothetical protein LOTGIDRAFT_236388 [Lottia gigantea]|uniref:Uncharacterized protein n=1 Tax=Lottia gigantea TaxID=225164 RepID=V3ZSM5_LOTGI|nr:hypothetical protein LOTGIDRAFT_236388 [Lottia gigantea]ESO83881.1 hypothetical protein LOTGIDRAFT_236388 [Lottia gigantea]
MYVKVPGDDLIYGFSVPTVTGTASVTDNSSIINTSPPEIPSGTRHVQFIEATPNHSFHLINIYNSPYLLSAEISALFWTNDLLSSELLKRDVSCTKIKVIRNERPELFQELQGYGVSSMYPDKQVISLYALEEVPKILELFDHESKELRRAICNMIQSFNIDDNYWKGIEEENKVEDDDEEEEFDLSARIAQELEESQLQLEELQLTLKAIEFKRKRILQEMMSHTGSSVELVNQLHEVEIQINMTTEVIEEIQKLQACNSDEEDESDCGEIGVDGDKEESENVEENTQTNVKTNRVAPLVIHPTPTKDQNEGESEQNTHIATSNTVQEPLTVLNSANPNEPQQQSLNQSAFANQNQNNINYLQQQHHQQLLLQSMMTSQMDPSFSGMMSPAGPYPSMMPNPILPQWGYFGQQMPVDPQNAMYWPNMMMAPSPSMNYEPQNNLQQMNNMRMPAMVNRMPNYTARLPAINPQNTLRLQSSCIPSVSSAQRFSIPPPSFPSTNHSPQSALNSGDVQQATIPTDTGILPNLLPLLQSLHMGRGKPQD